MTSENTVRTVIGIAASAGGLEAISVLSQHLPDDTSCAYVLAQHMSPHHASVLPTLLARETQLSVKAVEKEEVLQPDTIYVPVPKTDLVVEEGIVRACLPSGKAAAPKPSADRLFVSIAEAYGEASVGIVLSGTGSDGSYGIQAIREAGGITIAQDSETCKYDTMPMSAVETGCVDLILSPRQIGDQLANILARPRDFSTLQSAFEHSTGYDELFRLLLTRTKVNFRHYKENTVSRRIQRRLIALGFEEYKDYVAFCQENPEEIDTLYRDLLISVTRFFRDPEQFEALETALTSYVDGLEDRPLRVWIPGCATGEEAYSIAFILCDLLGHPQSSGTAKIQIFATDLDDEALRRGREGTYPAAASSGIPEEMQRKYFMVSEDVLRVKPEIRGLVLFSRHNVCQDPPFSDIDLVCFRNTMIYFDAPLQEKVVSRLLYALRPNGLLFLGASESIGAMEPYFDRVQDGARLFRKRGDAAFDHKALVRFGTVTGETRGGTRKGKNAARSASENNDIFDSLARAVAPVGFLANSRKDILRIYGDLGPFSRFTDEMRGRLSTNVLKSDLAFDASSLIPLCLKHGRARDGVWRDFTGEGFNRVRLKAYPVESASASRDGRMVLIGIETQLLEESHSVNPESQEAASYIAYVENELADAREALQITMEELQTSNEELQSTNEELQSTNEELQSTNEELETSNEELQSTNEELITVNEELLINSDELNRLVAEKNALQEALPLPLLVLDQNLNIKSVSKNALSLFKLSERGAHFGHISQISFPTDAIPPLANLCSDVLTRHAPRTETFELDGEVTELRITPYFVKDKELAGLTITLQRA